MKCISVKQPFAHFIAEGEKWFESRTWPTNYRGPLLIHAGLNFHTGQYMDADGLVWDCNGLKGPDFGLLLGHALCVVDVTACWPMMKDDERGAMCEIYPGAYVWKLDNPRKIEPFPMKGQLRLWDYSGPALKFI